MADHMGNTSEQEIFAARRAKRARAVRLSPDGIAALEERLETRWKAEFPDERLTRPLRAELLGISVRTADRLLSGNPVDRSSVSTAFARTACELLPEYLIEPDPNSAAEIDPDIDDETEFSHEADFPISEVGITDIRPDMGNTQAKLGVQAQPHGQTQGAPSLRMLYWALVIIPIVSVLIIAAATTDRGEYSQTSRKFLDSIQATLTAGHDAYQVGDYAKSEQLFYQAIEKNQTARDTAYFADAKRGLANIAIYRGEYEKALKLVNEAMTLQSEFDAENPYGPLNEMKGEIYAKMGNLTEAEKAYRTAIVFFGRSKDPMGVAMVQGEIGGLYATTGRLAEAEAELASSLKWLTYNRCPREIAAIKLHQSLLRVKQNRTKEAINIARESLAYFKQEGHTRWTAKSNFVLGRVLLAAGGREEAEKCFKEAARLYQEINDKPGTAAALSAISMQ